MTNTIPVPRAWLERLLKISDMTENDCCECVARLKGYISSAETLLTNGEKGEE
jgi:hypothetical protein